MVLQNGDCGGGAQHEAVGRRHPRRVASSYVTSRAKRPWWEGQIDWLRRKLQRHAARYASPTEAEDLAQDALASLTDVLSRRKGAVPGEWTTVGVPDDEAAQRVRLWSYAKTVLRRRIADRYRRRSTHWRYEPLTGSEVEAATASESLTVDDLARREIVAICLEALASLPEREREVVRLAIDGFALDRAMTPAERQRLSRARKRLAKMILSRLRERYGPHVEELFEEDLRR